MANPDPELKQDIKKLIVETLRLEEVKADDIGDADPLFSPERGLGLDSLSALEILSALEYRFGVRFESDGASRKHFESVDTLAAFVCSARNPT